MPSPNYTHKLAPFYDLHGCSYNTHHLSLEQCRNGDMPPCFLTCDPVIHMPQSVSGTSGWADPVASLLKILQYKNNTRAVEIVLGILSFSWVSDT